jgi:DNA polymerase III delta prime subunit
MKQNKSKKYNDWVWVEAYRPSTISEMVLPTQYKRTFNKMIKDKRIPALLLYSNSPGVGKTTLAKAICNELDADFRYINVSSESGIDTLRSKIQAFASTKSVFGGQKIVIMDEFDGASRQLQDGLRAAIEEFHKVCSFIFTCNYISRIIEPLRSRCQEYDMNFSDKKTITELKPKIYKRIIDILKHKKIVYDEETVHKLIDTRYPDIRKVIQLCQQYSNINGNIDNNLLNFEMVNEEFYNYILSKKFNKARKYVIEKNYNYSEMFSNLYKEFVPLLDGKLQPEVIITLAEWQHKHAFAIDPELNFAACLLEIMGMI